MKKILSLLLAAIMLLSTTRADAMLAEATPDDGSTNTTTQGSLTYDKTKALRVSLNGGDYENTSLRGELFTCADLGGTSVTAAAGLSAVNPALILYNPPTSTVNVVLERVTVEFTAAPAAAAGIMLAYNVSGSSAPAAGGGTLTLATNTSTLIPNTKLPQAQCYRTGLLPAAPLAFRFIGGTTGAAAIGGVQLIDEVKGEVILTPGAIISIQSTSAAAILASMTWRERPQSLLP